MRWRIVVGAVGGEPSARRRPVDDGFTDRTAGAVARVVTDVARQGLCLSLQLRDRLGYLRHDGLVARGSVGDASGQTTEPRLQAREQ
jgi:hypothetical protein